MKQFVRAVVLFVLGHIVVAEASAGIADSPLPVLLAGEKTFHVYSVPGIMGENVCPSTYFSCTSMDTATMQVGVELFISAGGGPVNFAAATSLSVVPGGTVTFGTVTPLDFGIHSSLGFLSSNGSARILSTSKKLACTAFITDSCFSPVTFMRNLTIIKKTTQKAAN